jgi:hypothetical protein
MRNRLAVCLVVWLVGRTLGAENSPTNNPPPAQTEVSFAETAPYSSPSEISRRFGFLQPAPDYDVTREKFLLVEPASYSTNGTWGLLVWVSPGDDSRVKPDWWAELEKHRLLFVGARNAGNNRNPIDRFRLALDATYNLSRRFNLERKRTFIGGMSGGARIASMLGVAYADIFTGALCICGVNFYKNVPAPGGQIYPATYVPPPELLLPARKNRFVLVTGEQDMNRQGTKDTSEFGFRADGFQNVLCLDVKGMKHELPGAPVLNTALNYLDGIAMPGPTRR